MEKYNKSKIYYLFYFLFIIICQFALTNTEHEKYSNTNLYQLFGIIKKKHEISISPIPPPLSQKRQCKVVKFFVLYDVFYYFY
jgi:hypothetical protein